MVFVFSGSRKWILSSQNYPDNPGSCFTTLRPQLLSDVCSGTRGLSGWQKVACCARKQWATRLEDAEDAEMLCQGILGRTQYFQTLPGQHLLAVLQAFVIAKIQVGTLSPSVPSVSENLLQSCESLLKHVPFTFIFTV